MTHNHVESLALSPVAVVGAGTIGSGVVQAIAEAGLEVLVVDTSDEALRRCRQTIDQGLRMRRLFGKRADRHGGGAGGAGGDVWSRIRFVRACEELAPAAYVVENVTEDWETKRRVYLDLDRWCRPEVVIAANTSIMPITRLASIVRRPERVIGIHFMNPVPMIATVELIRGARTSDETVETTQHLLRRLSKDWVEVQDSPGFVSNRVLMILINEAAFTFQERLAPAAEIDRIFTDCFGHKLGPLASADLIGLDTILLSLEGLYEAFGDPKFRPCPLLRQLVWQGRCGRKSGAGFFDYPDTGDDDAGSHALDGDAADAARVRPAQRTPALPRG